MESVDLRNKIENFAKLPDQECALLVQSHLLESLEIEDPTYLEWEMLTKFINLEYFSRDELCKLFNYYLKRNLQQIAGIPVNVWLKRYLEKYAGIPREPDTFFRYSTDNPDMKALNEKDQIKLMRIFRLYDYLLVEPVSSLDDIAATNITRFPMYLSHPLSEIKAQLSSTRAESRIPAGKTSVQMALKEAARKFPKLGEQTVTNSPIKLKSFDRPVRPSIKNWLYDYTSILGQGTHDSMQRTNYLFRSENTKNLSSPEREKLGIILKSFDENTPLPVDTENNEIVFDIHETRNTQHVTQLPSQKPAQEDFIRPYPRPVAKPPAPPRPVENNFVRPYPPIFRPAGNVADRSATPVKPPVPPRPVVQGSTFPPRRDVGVPQSQAFPDTEKIQFVNPYPAPETHEMAGEAPVKFKGFSEGFSKPAEPPVMKPPQPPRPKPVAPPEPPKPYAPSRSKNVIYPHYGPQREDKPEPKIDGNIVDLSGDK